MNRDASRIAVVNRGDAGTRFLQAVREYNLERGTALRTIAFHTDEERDSSYVGAADESCSLGPAGGVDPRTGGPARAYLDLDRLGDALRSSRADAAWVGWGFVSERADFAALCADLGVAFIGPSPEVIAKLGDKIEAKLLAESAGVPVAPWSGGPVTGAAEAVEAARRIGYPCLVKAAAGGGGRGIRVVTGPAELPELLESARQEALGAFGDPRVFIERRVRAARHIEVQIAADGTGTVWALGVRDCTVQRRRQKIIEESGAHGVDADVLDALKEGARRLARAAGYTGLGTVEFLLDPESGTAYFMEVNARLQVEHSVTEATTGVDLVKLQLDLLRGVPLAAEPPAERGVAIEARITAEDVLEGFRPAPGQVSLCRTPTGPGLRVDAGVREGDPVPPAFDPMLMRIIAHGRDRPEALARLLRGVCETALVVRGGATTTGLVRRLLEHPDLRAGRVHTEWVEELLAGDALGLGDDAALALAVAAVELAERERAVARDHLMSTAARGRPHLVGAGGHEVELTFAGAVHTLFVRKVGDAAHVVQTPDGPVRVEMTATGPLERLVRCGGAEHRVAVLVTGSGVQVEIGGTCYRVQAEQVGVVRAPSPAVVVQVRVKPGQAVRSGDVLAVLESMKLETPLRARFPGTVTEVLAMAGGQVDAGDPLVRMEPAAGEPGPPPARAVRFAGLAGDTGSAGVLAGARRRLLGFQGTPDELSGPVTGASGSIETDLLDMFADCCELADRRRATGAPVGGQELFFAYLRAPERGRQVLPEAFLSRLSRVLERYGAAEPEPGPELDEALYRLCCAQNALPEVEPVVVGVLRRWLDTPADRTPGQIAVLERLAEVTWSCFPAIADAAQAVAQRARTGGAVPAGRDGAGEPPADRLELWRFRHFTLDHVSSAGDVHLFTAAAKSNPEDRRLVVLAEVRDGDVPAELERTLLRGFGLMRDLAARAPLPGRARTFNRVVVFVEPLWNVPETELREIAHRVAPATRGLGLDKILIRIRRPAPDGGEPVPRLIHMTGPAEIGMSLGETAISSEPVRPLSPRRMRILGLRARGLRDPYEIVDLLVSPGAGLSDFPPGTFQEYDLDSAGAFVPVNRPPGENTAGIVAGIVENFTAKHPEGMRRVLLLSDPGRGLGALAEPECRRIIAAIDLAERLGLPVEWFTVSSGARISMTSGTENMDWVARALRRIVTFTQRRGEINIVVSAVNVGAQPYFNAEATMLMHNRGILVMTPDGSMVLTGKEALDFAGGVSAEDNQGIGGHDRVMGPNGQAQYWARDLPGACQILFRHYEHTYVAPGERGPRSRPTDDPVDRDVRSEPHPAIEGCEFTEIGQIFSSDHNPERKKPFDIRALMRAVIDRDGDLVERWGAMAGAENAVVADVHLGGFPVCLIGIESRPLPRLGVLPVDGPDSWSAATLFPGSSKKVARALNAASGNRPVVVLANLAGFDGSPESLRGLQLEYGAEIGRAVVNFSGPIVFCVVSRYHGGAFVVFSKALNEGMRVLAVEGARASVIGGSAAAAVVFAREVENRVREDPDIARLDAARQAAGTPDRLDRDVERRLLAERVRARERAEVARRFDAVHTVERAREVGSVDEIISPRRLRPALIAAVRDGLSTER